jgi:hypothetical protein
VGVGGRLHSKVLLAHGEVDGQVFLDGDLMVEVEVVGEIGDAEAALAQHLADAVPVQLVTRLERIAVDGFRHVLCPVAAASAACRWILREAGLRLKLSGTMVPPATRRSARASTPARRLASSRTHPLADGPGTTYVIPLAKTPAVRHNLAPETACLKRSARERRRVAASLLRGLVLWLGADSPLARSWVRAWSFSIGD